LLELPRTVSFGRDYWLGRCAGYRVDSPMGRVGVVESLRFDTRADRPDFLVVRTRSVRPRLLPVSVDDVEAIVPRERRLLLRTVPKTARADLVGELSARLRRGRG
jgi:hypothetical protein